MSKGAQRHEQEEGAEELHTLEGFDGYRRVARKNLVVYARME